MEGDEVLGDFLKRKKYFFFWETFSKVLYTYTYVDIYYMSRYYICIGLFRKVLYMYYIYI